jgi:predicted NBD/HSP70 family sugar kinase
VILRGQHGDWRIGTCTLDGSVEVLAVEDHGGTDPDALIARLRSRVRTAARRFGDRVVGLGVAAPGTVVGNRLVNLAMLGWRDLELGWLAPSPDIAVVAGNDATMAAVAEARVHAPRPRALLHVVEIGIGGALVVDGRPVPSARGLQGEYGHRVTLGAFTSNGEGDPCERSVRGSAVRRYGSGSAVVGASPAKAAKTRTLGPYHSRDDLSEHRWVVAVSAAALGWPPDVYAG